MRIFVITLMLAFVSTGLFAQQSGVLADPFGKKRLLDAHLNITKTGPYFGLQKGKYLVPEIGVERQWKMIRLLRTQTHAAHMGFNYNLKYNLLGYDAGYWWKPHRIGLTYGANLFLRSNFEQTKIGIAPVIGFKIWLLHFQTGYHFMPRHKDFETNAFFVSVRIGIINDRDFNFKR